MNLLEDIQKVKSELLEVTGISSSMEKKWKTILKDMSGFGILKKSKYNMVYFGDSREIKKVAVASIKKQGFKGTRKPGAYRLTDGDVEYTIVFVPVRGALMILLSKGFNIKKK